MPSFSLLKRSSRGAEPSSREAAPTADDDDDRVQLQQQQSAPPAAPWKAGATSYEQQQHMAAAASPISDDKGTEGRRASANGGVNKKERRRSGRDLLQSLINRSMGKGSEAPPPRAGAESQQQLAQQHRHREGQRQQPDGRQLLKRHNHNPFASNSASSNSTLVDGHQLSPSPLSPDKPLLSPRSPVNPNKPLPSPPPQESELGGASVPRPLGPANAHQHQHHHHHHQLQNHHHQSQQRPRPRPVLRLNRIMPTLSESDVEKLFSGAPQFYARSEGHFTGAPHPSVAFPWDESLEIRDLTDRVQIEDAAWGMVTAWPHITRDCDWYSTTGGVVSPPPRERKRAHFYPRCRERPNMLSMQGLEKGTEGYQAALEIAVADSLQEEQFGFGSVGAKARVVVEQRKRLLASKDGLRHLDENTILEQLNKNSRRYCEDEHAAGGKRRSMSNELYHELFLHVLHPPSRVLDHRDPYSLSVQIQALVKVLATPNVWIDFSHVEWRIRLGQILWGSQTNDELDDGAVPIVDADTEAERQEERYWLLLQMLLACELLVRLDAITEGEELGVESIKPQEVHRFEKDANVSVKWSLLLARAWLENIDIVKIDPTAASSPTGQHAHHGAGGWLAHLTSKISLGHEHHRPSNASQHAGFGLLHNQHPTYAMKGKHGLRQVEGLTHFAKTLRWPDMENYAAKISENCRPVVDGTPLSTPLASPQPATGDNSTPRSSYFGGGGAGSGGSGTLSLHRTSTEVERQPARRRKVSAALHPSGWLSKSYISGLMLPGEGLSHFLMSTLLENDRDAMARLGPMANLCGGFVYSGKSFWSTACIVGRVLAAGKGSAECMGWISSEVTPQGLGDGWVNIEVQELREDSHFVGKRARLWGKSTIERDSAVLGDADPASVLPADFVLPLETIYPNGPPPKLAIELRSLNLFAPVDSVHTTPTDEKMATPFSDATRTTRTTTATGASYPEIHTYPAAVAFSVASTWSGGATGTDGVAAADEAKEYTFALANDVSFVTAHPCVPSQHVRIFKTPSSPTIQQIDLPAYPDAAIPPTSAAGGRDRKTSSASAASFASASPSTTSSSSSPFPSAAITGHPLHKFYTYTAMHLSELLDRRDATLEDLLASAVASVHRPSVVPAPAIPTPPKEHPAPQQTTSAGAAASTSTPAAQGKAKPTTSAAAAPPKVLVIDCVTGFRPGPHAKDLPPTSPVVRAAWGAGVPSLDAIAAAPAASCGDAAGSSGGATTTATTTTAQPPLLAKMHHETRRRQFGSDMEMLVRALCAEKGWNAIISRRRRGCLACAIREAGALGWKVVVRVD